MEILFLSWGQARKQVKEQVHAVHKCSYGKFYKKSSKQLQVRAGIKAVPREAMMSKQGLKRGRPEGPKWEKYTPGNEREKGPKTKGDKWPLEWRNSSTRSPGEIVIYRYRSL